MTLFEAYVTNAGKYADYGVDAGEILKFPTTTEEVQSLLKRIGVDGVRYQEIFIVSFDGDVLGLYDYLNEYENLDELNHLAHGSHLSCLLLIWKCPAMKELSERQRRISVKNTASHFWIFQSKKVHLAYRWHLLREARKKG